MPSTSRSVLTTLIAGAVGLATATVLFALSGIYDVAADDPHTRPVHLLLETMRERSIDARAAGIRVPDLGDPARVRHGAGNYDAMCAGCHLAPGLAQTELARGLNPRPPDLTKAVVRPAHAFWTIKHGIKASGMPAWGLSMGDEDVWNLTAFLQQLPRLDPARYRELVDQSGGHVHQGGEGAAAAHDPRSGHAPHPPTHPGDAAPAGSAAAEPRHQEDRGDAPDHARASPRAHAPAAVASSPAALAAPPARPDHHADGHRH